MARQWFADVRTEQPKAPESKPGQDGAGDGSLLDWLFEDADGDGYGDGGD